MSDVRNNVFAGSLKGRRFAGEKVPRWK